MHVTLQACVHLCMHALTHAGPQVLQHSLDVEFSFVSSDDEKGYAYIAMVSDRHTHHMCTMHTTINRTHVRRRICVNARMPTHARKRTDVARAYAHIFTQTDLHTSLHDTHIVARYRHIYTHRCMHSRRARHARRICQYPITLVCIRA